MSAKNWFRRIVGEDPESPADAAKLEQPDLVDNTRQLLSNLLAHLRTRLELLGLELSIEKSRLLRTIAAGMLAGFFGLLTVALGALYVIAKYWDTPYRLVAVAWLLLAAFVLTALASVLLLQSLRQPSVLFSASAAELNRDIEVLEKA